MLRGVTVSLALCGFVAAADAAAEPVVWSTCGPLDGASHIVQGHGVNDVEVGGRIGGMAGETTLLYDADKNEQPFDVAHRSGDDATSLTATGVRVVAVETDDGGVVVAAVSASGIVETFRFLDASLVYTQSRHDGGRVATSTYIASCSWSR